MWQRDVPFYNGKKNSWDIRGRNAERADIDNRQRESRNKNKSRTNANINLRKICRARILELKDKGLSKAEIIRILYDEDLIPPEWNDNMVENQVNDYTTGGKRIYNESNYDR